MTILYFCPSSGILETRKYDFSETGTLSVLGWGRGRPEIEVTSFSGIQQNRRISSSPEDGNRSSFRNVVLSSLWNIGRWTVTNIPMILNVILHRQNNLETTKSVFLLFAVSYPYDRPWRPVGLWEVETSRFSRQSARRWGRECQPYATAALYSPETSCGP
jgi:hypothetical protein